MHQSYLPRRFCKVVFIVGVTSPEMYNNIADAAFIKTLGSLLGPMA